jgi:hypothetical protein
LCSIPLVRPQDGPQGLASTGPVGVGSFPAAEATVGTDTAGSPQLSGSRVLVALNGGLRDNPAIHAEI